MLSYCGKVYAIMDYSMMSYQEKILLFFAF